MIKKIYSNGYLILSGICHDVIEDEVNILIDLTSSISGIRRSWLLIKGNSKIEIVQTIVR
jgi:hypothetical protein